MFNMIHVENMDFCINSLKKKTIEEYVKQLCN